MLRTRGGLPCQHQAIRPVADADIGRQEHASRRSTRLAVLPHPDALTADSGGSPCRRSRGTTSDGADQPPQRQPTALERRSQWSMQRCSAAGIGALTAARSYPAVALDASDPTGECSGLGCAQQLLDTVEAPLSSAGPVAVVSAVLLAGTWLALRFAAYSRLEYSKAATISRHVPKGEPRILQIGGSTRDIFYLPSSTVVVTVVGEDVSEGQMEQAGIQAGIPVQVKKQSPARLRFQADESIDAVVAFDAFQQLRSEPERIDTYVAEVARVLKPGGALVFFERVKGEGLAGAAQSLLGFSGSAVDDALLRRLQRPEFGSIVGNTVLEGQDPHAVGVVSKKSEDAEPTVKRRGSPRKASAARGFG